MSCSSHANVHSSSRPHYCPIKNCSRSEGGRGFKRKNEMNRHGLVHQSPGYICPFCPEREHKYPRPDNLQRYFLFVRLVAVWFSNLPTDTSRLTTWTKTRTIPCSERCYRREPGVVTVADEGGRTLDSDRSISTSHFLISYELAIYLYFLGKAGAGIPAGGGGARGKSTMTDHALKG